MIHNIAHRGASAYEPENTLRAFERAIEMGATMLELDVHLSRDGRVVVIHDPDLARTTDGEGHVTDLSLAEIRRFDAGLGERVPILEEVVELVRGQAQLYVELKGQRTPAPVVDVLRRTAFVDGAILGSFYPWLPQRAKFLGADPSRRSGGGLSRVGAGRRGRLCASLLGACFSSATPTAHPRTDRSHPPTGPGHHCLARGATGRTARTGQVGRGWHLHKYPRSPDLYPAHRPKP
jgi:hypothetical protein